MCIIHPVVYTLHCALTLPSLGWSRPRCAYGKKTTVAVGAIYTIISIFYNLSLYILSASYEKHTEFRSCVRVELAVLGFPS